LTFKKVKLRWIAMPVYRSAKLRDELVDFLMRSPLARMQLDASQRPRITVESTVALASGSNRIGYGGVTQKLLAFPYTDTTTALGANASYIGTSRDTQIDSAAPYCYHGTIVAHAVSDQAGTLMIQESPDGSTWVTVKNAPTSSLTNPDGTSVQVAHIEHKIVLRYVRVAYRNGETEQTTFRLSSRVVG
jgi:hypothetical protein